MEDENVEAHILVMELTSNIEELIEGLPVKNQIELLGDLKKIMKDDPAETDDFFLIRTLELMVDNKILELMVQDLQRKLTLRTICINLN